MGVKETSYKVNINGEIGDLVSKVQMAKNSLDGLLKSGNAPKGLTSALERLDTLMGRIQDQAKTPPSKQMFSGLEKDVGKAGMAFNNLIRHIESLGDMGEEIKLELFPPEEQAKIQAAIQGLKDYGKALAEIAAKEKEVEKARKLSETTKGKAKTARDNKASAKTKLDKKVARKEGIQSQIKTLNPEKDATKIAQLNTQISELDVEIKELTRDFNAASLALTEANKAAAVAKKGFETIDAELSDLKTNKLEELQTSAKAAGVAIETIDGEDAVDTMSRLNDAVSSFKEESLKGLPENVRETKESLEETSVIVQSTTDSIRGAARAWDDYTEQQSKVQDIQKRIKDFLGYAGAAKILSASLKQAYEATKELDAAMTEIATVTDFNISDMWDQLPEYTQRANELGISITQAYKASALFYQQGLDTNEVVELSNETLKMAKIAGLDAAEATDRMTAALRGFNMELDQASAQKISDVYSQLAAITASDVDEISTAMTKTASIASSAGMEFETTAAFLSQIIETTRESAETAGTAMKTVIARFQELKKSPDEIGEVDGEIVDANQIESALRSVGVSLRDTSGQFRDLDDVFMELSSKWDSLDKNTQRYIATIAAGSRQQSRFIAMMQDYGRTQELVTAANNSAGASAKQYEKTMESLESKLTRLENAWTEFSTSLVNSDFIKTGVELLTAFVTAMNKATSALDGWMGSISKIGMILALLNVAKAAFNKFGQKLIVFFSNTGNQMGKNIADGIVAGLKAGQPAIDSTVQNIAEKVTNVTETSEEKEIPEDKVEKNTLWTREEKQEKTPKVRAGLAGKFVKKLPLSQIAAGAKEIHSVDKERVQSNKKAKVAQQFAQNGDQQLAQVDQALNTAQPGADLQATLATNKLGDSINALALPLNSIESQFKEKMKAMGYEVEEVNAEWEKLYTTIADGSTTAEQAVDVINESLNDSAASAELQSGMNGTPTAFSEDQRSLQVNASMSMEAQNKASLAAGGSIISSSAGLDLLSQTDTGDMQNTLAYSNNPLVADMQAIELPLQQIEVQYKEKMTAMGAATDQVEQEWNQLIAAISSGGTTADQALEKINQSLEDAANSAEKAGKVVSNDKRRIKNTKNTRKEAGDKKAQKNLEKEKELVEELEEAKEEAADAEAENKEKAEKSTNKQIEGYKKISAGLTKTGTALTMVGMGFTSVGSLFEQAGLPGMADTFNTMGTVIGTVGTVMTTLGTIMSFITPIIGLLTGTTTASTAASGANAVAKTGEAAANTAMGVSAIFAQLACWPLALVLLVILAVVIVLVVVIMALVAAFKAMAAASPAGQLKAAEEAAAAAAETAEEAAESYNNLVDSLEELDGKYKALEDLTEGTKEWNEAVRDINKSVLDLIAEYPELAKFVENKEGVLTIDMESSDVQGVMKQYEAAMVATQNAALSANMKVMEKREDLTFSQLDKGSYIKGDANLGSVLKGIGLGAAQGNLVGGPIGTVVGAIVGGFKSVKDSKKEEGRDTTEALAKALSSGDIIDTGSGFSTSMSDSEMQQKYGFSISQLGEFYDQVGGSTDELRKFGDQLNENSEQMKATYEAMATAAEQLANTEGWTEDEIQQGKNLIDGNSYQAFQNQANDAVGNIDFSSARSGDNALNKLDAEQTRLLDKAIEQEYGPDAKREGKEVTFKNADGQMVTERLDERADILTNLMKEIKATELTASAMEGSKTVIAHLNEAMGTDKDGKGLASKMYSDRSGKSLTMEDVENIGSAEDYWKTLLDEEKQVYGNDFNNFANDFDIVKQAKKTIESARESLEELGLTAEETEKIIHDRVSAGTATGLTEQYTKIAEVLQQQNKDLSDLIGSGGIVEQYTAIFDSLSTDMQDSLTEAFASVDVESIEDLNYFQWELINIYGIEASQAKKLTDSLSEAALASSDFNLVVDEFGELENVLESLAKTVRELTKIQFEYDEALRKGSDDIQELGKKQVDNLVSQTQKSAEAYQWAQKNLAISYAAGATASGNPNLDYRDYVTITQNGYELNQAKIQQDRDSGVLGKSEEDIEKFDTWLEGLDEATEKMEEIEDDAMESYQALLEYEQATKDAYYELRDMAKEAVLEKLEKQIELQEDTLEATETANDLLINKIQEQINETRQERENEKTEEQISDLRSQQAYLGMDTSSTNSLQLQQLDEQIKQAEEEYQNTLIDQTIQTIQDANEKAAEQRERQIGLAEQQLEAYQTSAEFQASIDELMREAQSADDFRNTTLYSLLEEAQTGGLSPQEKTDWDTELKSLKDQAAIYTDTDWVEKENTAFQNITDIEEHVDPTQVALREKTKNQMSSLQKSGFSSVLSFEQFQSDAGASYGGGASATTSDYETYLNKFDTFKNASGNSNLDNANAKISEMKSQGVTGIQTQSQYNSGLVDTIGKSDDPASVKSYSSYIDEQYNAFRNSFSENFQAGEEGWFPLQFYGWNGFAKGNNNGELDMDGAGVLTPCVSFGDEVTGAKAAFLKELMKLTYSADQTGHKLDNPNAETPTGHAQGIYYGDKAYAYYNGKIREINSEYNGADLGYNIMDDYAGSPSWFANAQFQTALRSTRKFVNPKSSFKKYKTGGLADFTGPAWLDGTKARPEYILNADQTKRFFSLVDVLEGMDKGDTSKKSSGDNYFDINIQVEKLENDYDVEQVADKIRRMIYEDASYRNVNAINLIR